MTGAVERQDIRPGDYSQALEIIWLAIIFLVPLFFNPLGHQAFYLNKALLLQFLVIAMLGFWVADWLRNQRSQDRLKWQAIFTSPLHLSILVFGLLSILSTAASITPAISFWGSYFRKAGLLTLICWILFFLIIAQQLRNRAQIFRAIYALLLSSGIVSLVGILQYFFHGILPNLVSTTRVFSTAGNSLSLSAFLSMTIPFNLALMLYLWSKRKERNNTRILIGLVILLALQFWCLWLAQHSITILLYIIAPVIFLIILGIVKRRRLLLSLGAVSALMLVVIAALLVAPLLFSSPSTETAAPADSESISVSEAVGLRTLEWRVQFWRSAVDILIESPEVPFSNDRLHSLRRVIGYGPETFGVTSQLFMPENMEEYYSLVLVPLTNPHNNYLYLATTIGLLGLLSFLSILAALFYLCIRYLSRKTDAIYKLLLIAMMAGMVQYMADIFFNPSTISPELVFWFTLGLVPVIGGLTMNGELEQATTVDSTETGNSTASYVNKSRRYVSAVSALLLILIGFGITIRPFLADMYLHKGFYSQARQGEQAIRAFDTAVTLSPGEAVYWSALGFYDFYIAGQVTEEALKGDFLTRATNDLEKARELEPYIAFRYWSLADVYTYWANEGAADKWPMAVSLYEKASQLIPRNAAILNKWSLALIIKGALDEARTQLDYAASIDPGWVETSFLSGLLLAKEGKNDKAALEIIAPIRNKSANLKYFINLCTNLDTYGMVGPLQNVLDVYVPGAPEQWAGHAELGITSLYTGNLDKCLNELNLAMLTVPDEDMGGLFRAILRLTDMSPPFKTALRNVAAEWRDKLSQSPERDTLLPAFDRLVSGAK
ncbi:MAG: O-antigen ligase family protein [Dehalococcoidia bacterium]|nr:O-antigen ligase family protein [Dehalococcoidia bacterium]